MLISGVMLLKRQDLSNNLQLSNNNIIDAFGHMLRESQEKHDQNLYTSVYKAQANIYTIFKISKNLLKRGNYVTTTNID